MLRGAFIRADGLLIPNNITLLGSEMILESAFRHTDIEFSVALANCVPDIHLLVTDLNEPTEVNGYARIPVTQDIVGWPISGDLNGESYIETPYLTWTAVGGPFDKPVYRLALIGNDVVMALSAAMPSEIVIGVDTEELSRKFKYRVYLR